MIPETTELTGYLLSSSSYGFGLVSLCEMAILFLSASISVITHSITSLTLNIFFLVNIFFSPTYFA